MQTISASLIEEIVEALQSVSSYGSIEIYVQNGIVTQITMRNIKKTNVELSDGEQKLNGHFGRSESKKHA